MPAGPANLALRTGAPCVPAWLNSGLGSDHRSLVEAPTPHHPETPAAD